jgi:hypothetical protein
LPGRWHNLIVAILKELCQDWVIKGKYKKVYDGNIDPVFISFRKHVYPYKPDLYAVWAETEKVDICEIIDTEPEGEAVMDIVYSALTPHVSNLVMICSDSAKLELIKTHARIILNKIFAEDGERFLEFNPRYFVHVPKDAMVKKTIKKQLSKQLEF